MSDGVAGGLPVPDGQWAGWTIWSEPSPNTFFQAIGRSYIRADGDNRALVGLETAVGHRNRQDNLHGGFIATFADHAFFGGLFAMGHVEHASGLTIDLSMQYLGAGRVGPPVMAEVELLRETGRLMFMRLMIRQDGEPIAASAATIRKASRRQ